ncbi:PD-(D/E)XK nuclease family protein [Litorilituus lipolyticus]|uniref:PD-(D/E)XK nuclease family protein n=1 Tax=Litorilituus lipolyticus TaxID=2491017 RepID=A0A502KW14_9GAMM|nr:PD-(D/E)XK nuclease family protein [Litorilituus lipolyticus]TPH15858.1 hypothetical protein EPA86_07775 [Litorilituus lipolyticus]
MKNEVELFRENLPEIITSLNQKAYQKFNLLQVIGLGSQEVKHSNLLGWLIDSKDHEFCHQALAQILQGFIYEQAHVNSNLQTYVDKICQHNGRTPLDMTVYRESLGDIDILIVDRANQVVTVIENKIWAGERTDGSDGGQLKKYEDFVKAHFSSFQHFFIFLTPSLEPAKGGNEHWMLGSYQSIYNVLSNLTASCSKTTLLIESYLELLVKENIVPNQELKEICESIWDDTSNRKALDTLLKYRPSELPKIVNYIKEHGIDVHLDDKNRLVWFDVSKAFELQNIKTSSCVRFCIDKYEGSYWLGFYIPYDLGIRSIECNLLNKYLPIGKRTKQTISITGDDYYDHELVAEHFINQIKQIESDIKSATRLRGQS